MASASIGSTIFWIRELQKEGGDHKAAIARLYRFLAPLVDNATHYGSPGGAADGEDAAMSALTSLCEMAKFGRLPHLSGRDDLKRWVGGVKRNKDRKQRRRERTKKRGGGHVRQEAAGAGLAELAVSHEQAPEFVAMASEMAALVHEVWDQVLDRLPKEKHKRMAVATFIEGKKADEIAEELDRSRRWVMVQKERIRKLFRERWDAHFSEETSPGDPDARTSTAGGSRSPAARYDGPDSDP